MYRQFSQAEASVLDHAARAWLLANATEHYLERGSFTLDGVNRGIEAADIEDAIESLRREQILRGYPRNDKSATALTITQIGIKLFFTSLIGQRTVYEQSVQTIARAIADAPSITNNWVLAQSLKLEQQIVNHVIETLSERGLVEIKSRAAAGGIKLTVAATDKLHLQLRESA